MAVKNGVRRFYCLTRKPRPIAGNAGRTSFIIPTKTKVHFWIFLMISEMMKSVTLERMNSGPDATWKNWERSTPPIVERMAKVTLSDMNPLRLRLIFFADAAGMITRDPIRSEPTNRMPRATVSAKRNRKRKSRRLLLMPMEWESSSENILRASFLWIARRVMITPRERAIEMRDSRSDKEAILPKSASRMS